MTVLNPAFFSSSWAGKRCDQEVNDLTTELAAIHNAGGPAEYDNAFRDALKLLRGVDSVDVIHPIQESFSPAAVKAIAAATHDHVVRLAGPVVDSGGVPPSGMPPSGGGGSGGDKPPNEPQDPKKTPEETPPEGNPKESPKLKFDAVRARLSCMVGTPMGYAALTVIGLGGAALLAKDQTEFKKIDQYIVSGVALALGAVTMGTVGNAALKSIKTCIQSTPIDRSLIPKLSRKKWSAGGVAAIAPWILIALQQLSDQENKLDKLEGNEPKFPDDDGFTAP